VILQNTFRSADFVFVISVFEAPCAIESAVAVNLDLRLELHDVSPQTASWSACVVQSVWGGGIQAYGIAFGTLWSKLARISGPLFGTQNSIAFEVPRH
jgi:hypothetical protein